MISLPNQKSIIQKIWEYKQKYIKDHGHPPTIIYLNPDEREDLRKALSIIAWKWPVTISGMDMRKEEEYKNYWIMDIKNDTHFPKR